MRSGILRTRVAALRLRADAPWPSQLFELDGEGRRWRYIFKALRRVETVSGAGIPQDKSPVTAPHRAPL